MKERRTFFGLIYLLSSAFFVCGVNLGAEGRDSAVEAKDAMDTVHEMLARNGMCEGFDFERDAIIEVASYEIELKDRYQLNESARRKAMEIAYLRAVGSIAEKMGQQLESTMQESSIGVTMRTSMRSCTNVYARVLLQAESCMPKFGHFEYMAAVAVVSSVKLSKTMVAAMNGDFEGMPEFKGEGSLKEWMDSDMWNSLGPRIVHDMPRHFWILGTASQEIDDELDKNALRVKAAYSVECALGGNVNVEQSSCSNRSDKGQETSEENLSDHACHLFVRDSNSVFEERIKLTPFLQVNPLSGRVKWFEREEKHPMTGKRIRISVAAIDSNDIPSFVRNGSPNIVAGSRLETSAPAIEQAQEFLAKTGQRQGFDEKRNLLVQVCSSTFDYEKAMGDEEFARKRYLAFKRALMMGAVSISKICYERIDAHAEQVSAEGWRSLTSWGSFVDDEDDKAWISNLIGRKFSWVARLRGSEGWLTMTRTLCGISVLGTFESLSEDEYQVALIVSLDLEKGKNEIMSFGEERPGKPGKMSLKQWMDTQDFGLVAGPRRFVDNEGTTWALGIVPAAKGQQPYGTMLDAAARECAAFAFGGELAVSIHGGDSRKFGDEAEVNARANYSGSIEYKAIGTDWYPRELEQYFRRPYTHPLTGRKGVVAICALRSGAPKIMNEILRQKTMMQQMRRFEEGWEKGMRDVMRERAKGLARELDFDSADVDAITQHRMRVLKDELSRIDVELQHERSMFPENRKRTEERLAEITRKVVELKGGKRNESQ